MVGAVEDEGNLAGCGSEVPKVARCEFDLLRLRTRVPLREGAQSSPRARNMMRRAIERGISDNETDKILPGSWLRILEALL
jgi:microsomal dipeptidase-like Zn-dependent dipeptidase